jgi:hypothetical protein
MVLWVGRRHGTCHASLGAAHDRRYLMGRLRAAWPDVPVHVRGDSGRGVPRMDDVCPERRLTYTFGIGLNSRLRALSDDRRKQVLEASERTGPPPRSFLWVESQAESGAAAQPVVIKAEAQAQGTNRRAVVPNRPGCAVLPHAVYDADALRGESAHRNKELKTELQADRLSDHRFLANFFRLYRHATTWNLLVRWRHAVVQPPPTSAALGLPVALPTEAIDAPDRTRFFNTRRERDPLGGGFACTWRTRLIKVAAEVITRARRVIVRLSGSWPHLDQFLQVSRAVSRPPAPASSGSLGPAVAPR